MRSINKITILGHVGNDPEMRDVNSDRSVARFRVATTRRYKSGHESKEETTWHTVECWNGLAEIVEKYVRKGMPVYVEGRLEIQTYQKDGQDKLAVRIVAEEVILLGGQGGQGGDEGNDRRGDSRGQDRRDASSRSSGGGNGSGRSYGNRGNGSSYGSNGRGRSYGNSGNGSASRNDRGSNDQDRRRDNRRPDDGFDDIPY